MTDGKPKSQVVPLLVAAIVCDAAVTDPSTNKKNLIGIFDRINVGTFPTQRPMSLYLKVADAEGHYEFQIRFVQVSTGRVLARADGEVEATDRLKSTDLHMNFPPLPIPEPGRYEFQIWANAMFLGQAFIDAILRVAPREEEERGN